MKFCRDCVLPLSPNSRDNGNDSVAGLCTTCTQFSSVSDRSIDQWNEQQSLFEQILDDHRSVDGANYDCIIPASGGRNCYWQAYVMKYEYGMNPLLVTWHGNSFLPEGQGNLDRMRDVLNIDHLVFGPGAETLRKLSRIGFENIGDINWQARTGMRVVPIRAAIQFNVPLVIWGEKKAASSTRALPDDAMRQLIRGSEIEARDVAWLRLPDEQAIHDSSIREVCLSDYFKWDPSEQALLMQEKFGIEFAREPFERTYCTMSNLNDRHACGVADYMNFVRNGYGHTSEQASRDVRDGHITRNEAIGLVRQYDHVKPRRDLKRWLEHVDMSEQQFDEIAETFRDPSVWWIDNGQWFKRDICGRSTCYGEVKYSDLLDVKKYRRDDSHHAA